VDGDSGEDKDDSDEAVVVVMDGVVGCVDWQRFVCQICQTSFSRKDGLTRHLREAKIKPQMCVAKAAAVTAVTETSHESIHDTTHVSSVCVTREGSLTLDNGANANWSREVELTPVSSIFDNLTLRSSPESIFDEAYYQNLFRIDLDASPTDFKQPLEHFPSISGLSSTTTAAETASTTPSFTANINTTSSGSIYSLPPIPTFDISAFVSTETLQPQNQHHIKEPSPSPLPSTNTQLNLDFQIIPQTTPQCTYTCLCSMHHHHHNNNHHQPAQIQHPHPIHPFYPSPLQTPSLQQHDHMLSSWYSPTSSISSTNFLTNAMHPSSSSLFTSLNCPPNVQPPLSLHIPQQQQTQQQQQLDQQQLLTPMTLISTDCTGLDEFGLDIDLEVLLRS
jgi:hypothetical protein